MKRDYYSDFFFNPHELAKIVLQKLYGRLWCQIEPIGLANKKVFPFFLVTYNTGRDNPPFSSYSALCEIFSNFFPAKGPLSIFFDVLPLIGC